MAYDNDNMHNVSYIRPQAITSIQTLNDDSFKGLYDNNNYAAITELPYVYTGIYCIILYKYICNNLGNFLIIENSCFY